MLPRYECMEVSEAIRFKDLRQNQLCDQKLLGMKLPVVKLLIIYKVH